MNASTPGFSFSISPCCCALVLIGVVVWLVMRSRKSG